MLYRITVFNKETGELRRSAPAPLDICRNVVKTFEKIDTEYGTTKKYKYIIESETITPEISKQQIEREQSFLQKHSNGIACLLAGAIFGTLTLVLILLMI